MAASAAGAEPATTYSLAVGDVTTEPAIIGRPTLFVLRRREGNGDSLRATGSLDHTRSRPRDVVNVVASGLRLPPLPVPQLPYTMDPGRGHSELRFALDGDQISGRWVVRSSNLAWRPLADSSSRRLNTIESLVARVLTGIKELQMTAEISGSVAAPRLAVRSNLDRQVADRLRSVAGEEVAAAEARVRAQVDRLVEEKTAPVRQRVDSLRAETEQRVAQARIRLDEEKRKLEERIRTLGGGALGLPRLPRR
jgi:hypothetical protein